ncbi:MAG: tetratricopeptide repeat protein [Anaerolineales bacterium]|nr:tetratricopeptide repeat protein [Anaerolineales bacterium]
MRKRRRRSNPWRVLLLLILIAAAVYVWQIYVPTAQPLFVPTPTPTRSPASFVLEAESFFQAGKLALAEVAYQEAITVDPREISYYINLARVRVFAGDYDDAETAARNALVIDPDSALANAVLGWALDFRAGQAQNETERSELLAAALSQAERSMELNPNSALVRAFYAEVVIDNNIEDYEEALTHAEYAVRLDPNLLEAHRALGYVWEMTGNYALAVESYEAAKAINPNLPRLHIDVGNMLQAQGEVNAAIDSYKNAIALAPTNIEPLTLIAQVYARIGEFGKASQFAADAADLDPANPRLRGNLGRMYYHNNVLEDAITQLELAIRGGWAENGVWVQGLPLAEPGLPPDPRVVEFYYTYGLALAKQARCDEAVPIFEALLLGVPDDEIAVFNAQEGLILCGQLERTPVPEGEASPTPES